MNTEQQQRFKDAPWLPKEGEMVVVGGAGGIGSWLCYFLSKIGTHINLYDFDLVEEHNLGGQLFFQRSIGIAKTVAVAEVLSEFCSSPISCFTEAVTIQTPTHHFCFSAFDNMSARKTFFEVWKKSWANCPEGVTPLFIDGRLELEQLQVFCVTPATADRYDRDYLFDDSRVEDLPCSMKQTSHTAAMIATIMTSFFTNHLANTYQGEIIRDVPFFYDFIVPMVMTNLEI